MNAANPSVNRCLDDKAMDHIDHALGRPVWPEKESYRNYFATGVDGKLARAFDASAYWQFNGRGGTMAYYSVTAAGRAALAAYLSDHDNHRPFEVTFNGISTIVPAKSAAKARYSTFLDVRDAYCDLTFGDFARNCSVRAAT